MRYVLLSLWITLSIHLNGQELSFIKQGGKNYLVGVGDVLSIQVFDEDNLSGQYTVKENGSITFPLIGEQIVWHKDVIDIQHQLTEKLEKDYLYSPIVNVSIYSFQSQTVYMLGNISKPGAYHLKKPTYLLDLLSDAKGLSQNLGLIKSGQKVDVNRRINTLDSTQHYNDTTFSIDLYQLLIKGRGELNLLLQNEDIIYISGQQMVHVVGQVVKPGSFPYEDNMTALKAITLAGGPNNKGSTKKVIIKRIVNNKMLRIKAKLEDKIQADDILEVPLSVW